MVAHITQRPFRPIPETVPEGFATIMAKIIGQRDIFKSAFVSDRHHQQGPMGVGCVQLSNQAVIIKGTDDPGTDA